MLSKPPASKSHPEVPPSRRTFALTLLTRARNPIKLARALYLAHDLTPHTLLSGSAAEHLAEKLGEELTEPAYFFTLRRWREHRRGLGLPDHPFPPGVPAVDDDEKDEETLDLLPKGTVGAVALDERGCIAVATSTGGLTNKLPGRIGARRNNHHRRSNTCDLTLTQFLTYTSGDTPQLGAGFYAHEWAPRNWVHKTWRRVRRKGKRAVGISGTGNGDVSTSTLVTD
jgi:beta-aspartyl-peptidase (threonine type)